MRVLICPDKFAGTLTAVEAAEAIAAGWRSRAPEDDLTTRPLADGGPGFLDAITASVGGRRVPAPTCDPLGRPAPGWVLIAGQTGYVESAQACGLHLLAETERDPKITTSYGLGALVATAVESGVREVVIGLGGSATNDAGAGMLAALGAAPLDAAGYTLPYGGASLLACARLGGRPRLRGTRLIAATDVDNPLIGGRGASAVFGPQKGASPQDARLLDAALAAFASVLEQDLPTCPPRLGEQPAGGAAGGLGAAILACGGRCESGIAMVRALTGLDEVLDQVDLVITGEGGFDHQSLRGKVVAGIAAAARERDLPCLVVAGRVEVDRHIALAAGVTRSYSLVEHFGGVRTAMARPAEGLRSLGAHLANEYHPAE